MVVAIEAMFRMSLLINDAPIAKLRGIEKHIVVEGIITTVIKAVLIDVESHVLIIADVADIVIRCCALGSVARM